jgi:hypothetical protein
LKSKLAEVGLEPSRITMMELENLVICLETVHLISEAAAKNSDKPASQMAGTSNLKKPNQDTSQNSAKSPGWQPKVFDRGEGDKPKPNPSLSKPGLAKNLPKDRECTKRLCDE